jgi:hypothetical protein
MRLVMDLGYTNFEMEDDWEKYITDVTDEERQNGEIHLSAYTVFQMLKAMPKGTKWNPISENFEKIGD